MSWKSYSRQNKFLQSATEEELGLLFGQALAGLLNTVELKLAGWK